MTKYGVSIFLKVIALGKRTHDCELIRISYHGFGRGITQSIMTQLKGCF